MINRCSPYRRIVQALGFIVLVFSVSGVGNAQSNRNMTKADVDRLIEELSNWGRWGKDDQLGALNLITEAKRREAAKLVELGISVSLARNVEKDKASDNPDPFEHTMLPTVDNKWVVDQFTVAYHGYAHTHMDSLCHLYHRGKFYNGFSKDRVTSEGAKELSIDNIKQGIFSRGVLMDIPRLRGVDYLEPGSPIYPEELEAWENRAGITVSSGDIVFIYTGRWARREKTGAWGVNTTGMAGLHASCAKWLHARDIAMLGSDAASDVIPSRVAGVGQPIHLLTLHAMGVHIFDNCDLEDLSAVAAKYKRWEFLITASPIPVTGGTGSPLNPIATF